MTTLALVRENDPKCRAGRGGLFEDELAAMRFGDPPRNRQPQAGPFRLRIKADKPLENAFPLINGDHITIVADGDRNCLRG